MINNKELKNNVSSFIYTKGGGTGIEQQLQHHGLGGFDNNVVLNCMKLSNNEKTLVNISDTILTIYPWVMLIFGTISNTLSISVLTRPKLRKLSTFFYLAYLSAIDLLNLYTFCINFIFLYNFDIDLQAKHPILCKVYAFLIYFLPQYSAWTCVAVSIDRVISVIFAVQGRHTAWAKRWNQPDRALHVSIVIGVVLFLLNLQFFFYSNYYEPPLLNDTIKDINIIYCSPEHSNHKTMVSYYSVWVHIDLSINVLIPFAIMIICSLIIIIRVQKTAQNLENTRRRSAGSVQYNSVITKPLNVNSNNTTTKNGAGTNGTSNQAILNNNHNAAAARKKSVAPNSSSKARSISIMLAVNNFVFISLTLPIVVFLSMQPNFKLICDHEKALLRLIKIVCIILMNTNCTVNIFIFSVMASQFRRELFSLVYLPIRKVFSRNNQVQLGNDNKLKKHSIINQTINEQCTSTE